MKKLLAFISCMIYLNSFSQAPIDSIRGSEKATGHKVLIKALAVFANPDAQKKAPAKCINICTAKNSWL